MLPTDLFSAMRLLEWAFLALCIHMTQSRFLYKRQVVVETTEAAETTVAETTVEETTVAETTAAETTVEETTVAATTVAETTVEETTVAETTAAETTVEETTVAETTAAETTVAETTVEETTAAETTVAETTVEETTAAETTVAETTVEETTVAETTASETTVEETTVAETTTTEGEGGEATAVPYGDELITPKSSYVDEPYKPKKGKPSGYSAGEQGSGSISQGGYSGNIKVVPSGYRRKRGNEYGDENLIPPTPPSGDEYYPPEGEETPAPADQVYGQDVGPAVEPGGYRRKRHNEYGDESVTPSTPAEPYGEESFTEETPATAGQKYGCSTGRPPVYPGGYRRKRQNEYGDESVTPSTPATPYGEESFTEETPEPIDQGYGCNEGGPPVEPGGYRKKRDNEYGDENVTPSTPAKPYGEESFTEETPATAGQEYGGYGGPPVQPGGYRRKRHNEYGDENVTPTTPATYGGEEYFTEETPATAGQEYGGYGKPPVKPAGYRKKRHNEYGDENVTPSTPAEPYGEESFTEETPATAGQKYGCTGRPPVYPGGYRRKRQNEYGDESVTPSTPATPYGEESFTEQTPEPVDQGYDCNEGGPPVEPAGYRKKRHNEYGDENVTPTTPATYGGEEYFTEETPATAGQEYGGYGKPPVQAGGYRKKRDNEYGDENVTPSTPAKPYGEEYFTEETPATAGQEYGGYGKPPVKSAGYRKKRHNEYGDENVTPSTPAEPYGEESFTEETPATVGQKYGCTGRPPVYPGGYRRKRQNEYGDESVTPSTPATPYGEESFTEETPEPVDQGYGCNEGGPPVEPGGYRKKRDNEYGDENVTPTTPAKYGGEEYFTEETPATAGQEYGGYGKPPVQPGGYRKKRHNEYGDENVTPSTPAEPYGEESFTEETPATAGQEYGGYGGPPVQPGGYRKKRDNEYGDENVTPSTPAKPYGEESFTEETPATAGQEYGGYGGPPVQPGGYRKKRDNEYGDENVTPSTPAKPYGEESFTEETPATAGQEYGGYGGPPVQPGGYRKKRDNEYGDENVTPSTPAKPYGEESFTEETPATAGQEYGGYGGPPVQPGGYRKKRHNEYGDENVTPSTPAEPYGEESFTEETPATAGQKYGCTGRPPVYPGGYRRKRQNEYGDESVTPSTPATPYGEESFTEQTPEPVDQGYGCNEGSPPVEPGGYQK